MLKCTGTCNFISFFGLFCGQQWDRLYKGWISHQRNSIISVLKIMYNKLSTSINIGYIYGTLLPDKRTLQWDTSSTWDSKSQPKKSKPQIQYILIRNHPSIMTCFWQSKFFSIKFPSAAILSKLNEHNVFSSLNVSHYLILIATYTSRVDGCTRLVLHNSWYEPRLICFNISDIPSRNNQTTNL